jgi:hypothetical protein
MAEIAVREGITDNYVSNLIHLAWLSPDLVSSVLDGDPEASSVARAAMLTRKSDIIWNLPKRIQQLPFGSVKVRRLNP